VSGNISAFRRRAARPPATRCQPFWFNTIPPIRHMRNFQTGGSGLSERRATRWRIVLVRQLRMVDMIGDFEICQTELIRSESSRTRSGCCEARFVCS